MVQEVKRCLRNTVGHTSLTYDQLQTLLVEVKAVIYAHPLTYCMCKMMLTELTIHLLCPI